jgi:ribosome-associated protein
VLRVIASRHRSQAANRDAAEERMAELLRKALEPRRARVRTLPPVSVERERLNEKRRRSEIKRHRSRVDLDED